MHLFYTPDIQGDAYTLSADESKHCVRVLRLAEGAEVVLVDGAGGWYRCTIDRADAKGCRVRVLEKQAGYGKRPFRLHLAVAPTKNSDRTEWMLEKCTEIGTDRFTLLRTARSERKTVNDERLEKVIIAAMKQSLKAYKPEWNGMTDFREIVRKGSEPRKFIAHCGEGEKARLEEVYAPGEDALILIGPEGDFSPEEIALATEAGFIPITLGESRLRTETAGIVACHSIHFLNKR